MRSILSVVQTVNFFHTDVGRGQIKRKHPQEPSTSGSVDSAAGLAATTRWWIPWCFGLLVQTGIISIWVTAVIVTIVSLPTLCRTTVWTLYFDKACSTMKFPQTRRGSFKNKQTNKQKRTDPPSPVSFSSSLTNFLLPTAVRHIWLHWLWSRGFWDLEELHSPKLQIQNNLF